MAEDKEAGFMGQIRRLSRRLSGTILSADARDVKAYLARNDKRNVYTYDSDDQMKIGMSCCKWLYSWHLFFFCV